MAKRYGLVIDLERCTGCHACTIACKVENSLESSSGIRVETVGGAHPDTPSGTYPELRLHYMPVPCMHCEQPPCVDACPMQAIQKRTDGIVLIDGKLCDGCRECLPSCPYQALTYDPANSVVRKCDLCHERLDEGFEPFCALCCGPEAIFYGDLSDPKSDVAGLIARRKARQQKQRRCQQRRSSGNQ